MEGEGSGREGTGEVSKVDVRSEQNDTRVHGKGEITKGKIEDKGGKKGLEMEERLAGGRGSELARKCWEEVRERARRGGDCRVGKGKGRVSSKTEE